MIAPLNFLTIELMENNEIKNTQDLADRLAKAIIKKEAFTINATFTAEDGQTSSVFFVGGKLQTKDIVAHMESLDAMIKTINGHAVPSKSLTREKNGNSYTKNEDGSFKLTFKKNDQEETPA